MLCELASFCVFAISVTAALGLPWIGLLRVVRCWGNRRHNQGGSFNCRNLDGSGCAINTAAMLEFRGWGLPPFQLTLEAASLALDRIDTEANQQKDGGHAAPGHAHQIAHLVGFCPGIPYDSIHGWVFDVVVVVLIMQALRGIFIFICSRYIMQYMYYIARTIDFN